MKKLIGFAIVAVFAAAAFFACTKTVSDGRVDVLEKKVDTLCRGFAALIDKVQSVTVIPDYSDGSVAFVKQAGTQGMCFEVSPAEVLDSLVYYFNAGTTSLFSILAVDVETRGESIFDTLEVKKAEVKEGLLVLTVNTDGFNDAFWTATAHSARLSISDGLSDVKSSYFPLALKSRWAVSGLEIYSDGNSGKGTEVDSESKSVSAFDFKDNLLSSISAQIMPSSGSGVAVLNYLPVKYYGNSANITYSFNGQEFRMEFGFDTPYVCASTFQIFTTNAKDTVSSISCEYLENQFVKGIFYLNDEGKRDTLLLASYDEKSEKIVSVSVYDADNDETKYKFDYPSSKQDTALCPFTNPIFFASLVEGLEISSSSKTNGSSGELDVEEIFPVLAVTPFVGESSSILPNKVTKTETGEEAETSYYIKYALDNDENVSMVKMLKNSTGDIDTAAIWGASFRYTAI